nr:Chain C, PEPTIDE P1049 (ALWGFFPVL) [unidentified]1B0G_F Chain F, PEPTIDE P1049 (ALWGFFPVL) [unidentified]1LP9_C Chain C, self-peptide P1049 [synthetic construct]1LP9_J Chain J, self-peptide P1049 [synthetic construct]2J8U_C Chain C, SELF-PEPTIDE P1049 [Homo sapiens]2J8U_J Chain J, SELF-PEPTIDE P1049 [Homo sapiens]2JCC_C Chain C, P1049 [Homo sapiens]2JCC_J Chain J, P1049 [Homo sapiens]2UWE_C Chain C, UNCHARACTERIZED PROTEIN C15ORF24 [Homo sapiens]2UWE_J Chain J, UNCHARACTERIZED PROTEIN C
ALWGFFPVL